MTSEAFTHFWNTNYPEIIPIAHHFKHIYADRWFRIHSLPKSKRYADTQEEMQIILDRQNTLITDLLGYQKAFYMLVGEYDYKGTIISYDESVIENLIVKSLDFTPLAPYDLNQIFPEDYEPGEIRFYNPFISEQIWIGTKFDAFLKAVANDELEVIFIGVEQECLIAPYDGGVDIILKTETWRDTYKNKYKDWLSMREDGF